MKLAKLTERAGWGWMLGAALAAVCAWLYLRTVGTHPSIFADEWYYSEMSRLQPLSESLIPSWLYLWLYHATNACGAGFYACARGANVLFFGAAAPFLYLTARRYAGRAAAAALTLLALLAPLNLYTAFFMPEAMYYFGFCVLGWIALTRGAWHWAAFAAATGLVLGLMSMVKVHGLFLIPALCGFLLYARWAAGGRWFLTGVASAAIAAGCVLAVKFGLGYLLAGPAALSLFGNFYGGAASSAGFRGLLSFLPAAFINARGHLMALVLLAPLPLALIIGSLLQWRKRGDDEAARRLQLFVLLTLGAAAAVTILYTGSIAEPGVTREGLRLHQRYYSFAFPLLWLVAAATPGAPRPGNTRLRWGIAVVLSALLAIAWLKLPTYALNPIDGPDAYAVDLATPVGRCLLALDLAILLLWAAGRRAAAPLFLFAALPLSIGAAIVTNGAVIASNLPPGPAEHAAADALRLIPPGERKLATLAADDMPTLMHLQFNVDDAKAAPLLLEPGAAIEQYQLPVHNKWLLVLGEHALPATVRPVAHTAEYTLVRINATHHKIGSAMMNQPFGNGILAGAEGLSHIEPTGRWSDGKQVVLHLDRPLPRHARVILKALAYDVNTGLPFTMQVGSQRVPFRVGMLMQDVALVFDTDGRTRDLLIDVPHPIAPAERGKPDARKLGIFISEIEIGDTGEGEVASN